MWEISPAAAVAGIVDSAGAGPRGIWISTIVVEVGAGIRDSVDQEATLGDLIAWRSDETAHPELGRVRPYTSHAMSTTMASKIAISWRCRCHGITRSLKVHP
jgi:hypothetical protein